MKTTKAYSLVEVLVVLGVFAVLTVLSTQSIVLTLRSARKAESSIRVRDDLNYRVQVIQRQLASANSITCTSTTRIDYLDYSGVASSFSCSAPSGIITMASGSASLDNAFTNLTACNFTCSTVNSPSSINVSLTGQYNQNTGIETVSQTVSSKIFTHLND